MRLILALLLTLPPVPAAHVAAWLNGRPDLVDRLVRICKRESRCKVIGLHSKDATLDPSDGWSGQVRLEHLEPWCQPYRPDTWSTRGAWGLSAASHWHYLPRCYQPEVLDVPLVSAWVATRKLMTGCPRKGWGGWCGPKPRRRRR